MRAEHYPVNFQPSFEAQFRSEAVWLGERSQGSISGGSSTSTNDATDPVHTANLLRCGSLSPVRFWRPFRLVLVSRSGSRVSGAILAQGAAPNQRLKLAARVD